MEMDMTPNLPPFIPNHSLYFRLKEILIGLIIAFAFIGCAAFGYYLIYDGDSNERPRRLAARTTAALTPSLLFTAPFLLRRVSELDEDTTHSQIEFMTEAVTAANLVSYEFTEAEVLLDSDEEACPKCALGTTEMVTLGAEPTQYSSRHIDAGEELIDTNNAVANSSNYRAKIRVGFLSAFWYHHSVGLLLRGIVSNLPASIFEVYLLSLQDIERFRPTLKQTQQQHQEEEEAFAQAARDLAAAVGGFDSHRLLYLSAFSEEDLDGMRTALSALHLDILVFGEIGMDVRTYFLAFARLARRTVVFWGHASTSGISPLDKLVVTSLSAGSQAGYGFGPDYFISSELFEPYYTGPIFEREHYMNSGCSSSSNSRNRRRKSNVQKKYSERLLLLPGLSFGFFRPPPPSFLRSGTVDTATNNTTDHKLVVSNDGDYESPIRSNSGRRGYLLSLVDYSLGKEKTSTAFRIPKILTDSLSCDLDCPRSLHSKYRSLRNFGEYTDQTVGFEGEIQVENHKKLADELHIYAVPQTVYKLHPLFDQVLLRVLQRDTSALILLLHSDRGARSRSKGNDKHERGGWFQKFESRIRAVADTLSSGQNTSSNSLLERLLLLPRLSSLQFSTVCALADVVIDPFPVGGGRSTLEIFATGVFVCPHKHLYLFPFRPISPPSLSLSRCPPFLSRCIFFTHCFHLNELPPLLCCCIHLPHLIAIGTPVVAMPVLTSVLQVKV
jgi:hypothetical protein